MHYTTRASHLILPLISLFAVSCAVSPDRHQQPYGVVQPYEVIGPQTGEVSEKYLSANDLPAPPESKKSVADNGSEVLNKDDLKSTPPLKPSPFGEIPLPINKYVKKWLNYYTGNGRSHMQRYLSRSSRYLPEMKKILLREGLPEDLVYLPVIESGFQSKVNSHAGASGYWQFMKGSAKDYGLRVGNHVDERHDFIRSTEAAATYLKRLYTLFGDWYLALAAYNTGENRVKSQLMRAETRDYWSLVKSKRLYRETRNYVPKFIAATLIAKNPVLYGFTDIPYQNALDYESFHVKRPIDLKKLARHINVPLKKIKKLNPKYRTEYVPIYRGKSSLVRVPAGKLSQARRAIAKSQAKSPRVYRPLEIFTHRVRRGDNLSRIAKRYRVSVRDLRRANALSRRSILRVGQKIKIVRGKKASKFVAQAKVRKKKPRNKVIRQSKVHTVRRGENLSVIAKKHGMSLSELLKINRFKMGKMLYVGQKIKLRRDSKVRAVVARKPAVKKLKKYRVKPGDNLEKIAETFGVTVNKIKKINRLKSSKILVGQKLKLMGVDIKVHVVKRGENLISIANKYKVSLSKILNINNIKSKSKIHIGREIKVPVAMN